MTSQKPTLQDQDEPGCISTYGTDSVTCMQRGLGTQLRHLIELLDGAVAEEYSRKSLNYRPRYTPVMRALMTRSPLSVTEIAKAAGITQPAATQTIALMIREGLLVSEASLEDSRQKVIKMTRYGCDLLPHLQACWETVTAAANSLDGDLPFPLSQLLDLAIEALADESFGTRIQAATHQCSKPHRDNQ